MSDMALPRHARVVVVGGGIVGCSVAYHLALMGWTDVVLLEQGQLTSGTTWHAAGLVGQMRANRSMTRMSTYGIDLYARLEQETGLATGWRASGSVTVARTPERMQMLRRQMALARSFGVEVHDISPLEVAQRVPLLRTDDLCGAVWLPGDGKANPADLTMSLAKGARQRGVKIFEGVEVTGVLQAQGEVRGVQTDAGVVGCEMVVNCAGQWARQLGQLAGVTVPLFSAEHFYVVTGKIDGIHPMWPVVRDPDGFIYYKEEVGGLVMGGFEPVAKPWRVDPIPASFQFQLLGEDWDQFEVLMRSALHRTPCLETADIKMLLNGPESFTPDGNFIIGEAPELRHYFVCAGFNSAGIANAGGAGRLMAEWMVQGAPSVDVWDVDIRRFAPFTSNRRALAERTVETLGLHYAMRWPRQELQTVRPLRTSPLYDALAAKGAVFGSKNGWERVNYFKPVDAPAARDTLGTPDWLPWVQAEQAATREAVALYDQTSFGKLLVQGPDALALLQHLCMRNVDTPVGQMVYTPMLNDRGGHESDLTVLRLASDAFLLITGSAQVTRDMDWIRRHMARMSYVGGLGFELYVPVEMTRHVYQTLHTAGSALGLRDAGYYALDALRTERARRAWGAELGPGETPIEARMLSALPVDKSPPFKGQQALRDQWPAASHIKLVRVLATQPDPYLWGGEPLVIDGQTVGEITSVGWGHEAGACVGMAYLRGDWAARDVVHQPASAMLWGEPVPVLLHDLTPPQ